MKRKRSPKPIEPASELAELRARLCEAEETIEAIRTGGVDALVVSGPNGEQVYTLKGAERPYRLVIEAMHEGALMVDAAGTVLYCNSCFAEMIRRPLGKVIGKPLADFVTPEQALALKRLLHSLPEDGRKKEFSLIRGRGSRALSIQLAVRKLDVDGAESLSVVATDLTTQKLYQAALKQTNEQLEKRVRRRTAELQLQREWLRVTLTSIGDAVIACDTSGKVTFINPVAAALTGWAEEDALGQPANRIFRIINEQTREPIDDFVAGVLRDRCKRVLSNHTALLTRQDKQVPVEDSAAPILDAQGNVTGVVLVFHDVTERRGAQRELQRRMEQLRAAHDEVEKRSEQLAQSRQELEFERQRYEDLFDLAPVAYIVTDLSGKVRDVNEAACRLMNLSPSAARQAQLQAVLELVGPETLPGSIQELKDTGNIGEMEGRLARASSSPVPVLLTANVMKDQKGELAGVRWQLHDMTRRKQAEEAAQRASDQLARVNAALEQKVAERTAKLQEMVEELEHFSYTITHDMRAPLRALYGFAELMEQNGDALSTENKECLGHIKNSARRMDLLITDALHYSKAVQQELVLVPLDPAALLRSMIESYPAFQPPQAQIQIDGEIPQVQANEAGLTQCFSNLLGNAVKFVRPGQVPQVRIWAGRVRAEGDGGEMVRIWFEDNGIGIPEQLQTQLFQMFQRASRAYEGTGIGLALVRKVTERMGGRVGAESEPGKGSRFWLELRAA